MIRFYLLLLVISSVLCPSLRAQDPKIYSDAVDPLVNKYMDSLSLVGMSVAVIDNQKTVYKKSYGYANLELEVKMKNNSVYRIWSISKQFCAVAILKLEEQGKLALNDPIAKYLDSIPSSWRDISIEQLLNQTGGIKDYLNDYKEGKKLHSTPFEIVRDSAAVLKFTPGEDWSYTNTGYWVLAKIVEAVSDRSYQDFLRSEFFIPLGMDDTQRMDYFRIIKNRVNGYRSPNGVPSNSRRHLDEYHLAEGDAELISTLEDLNKWALALFSGKFISQKQLQRAWTKAKTNNGKDVSAEWIIYYDDKASYGMGWFISELKGEKIVWTPGAGRGFSTTILTVPNKDLHVIILSNARRFLIADKLGRAIVAELLNLN